jgi:hypothetical protein
VVGAGVESNPALGTTATDRQWRRIPKGPCDQGPWSEAPSRRNLGEQASAVTLASQDHCRQHLCDASCAGNQ